MVSRTFIDKKTGVIYCALPQPSDAKFLRVAAEGGKVVEINHFGSFKDAKQVFDEIASDHGCYDVSIWRWTENRYVRISYTDKLG